MTALIQPFLNLLFFRGKVEDIPASSTLLGITIASCFFTDLISSLNNTSLTTAFIVATAQIILLAGFLRMLLALHKKSERLTQALIALLGVLSLLNLLAIPLSPKIDIQESGELVVTSGLALVALLEIWYFIVMARVLQETLEISMLKAVIMSFFLSYGIALTILIVFGGIIIPDAPS